MTTKITYTLSIDGVPFIDADAISSLDTAKETAKAIMLKDRTIDSVEINRKDSRFAGMDYEGCMNREVGNPDEFWFDSMSPEPPIRFLIIAGSETNQSIDQETFSSDRAINAWCDRIKRQGTIEEPWICRIQEEIYSDDGEWCEVYDGEPWKGFYLRREP